MIDQRVFEKDRNFHGVKGIVFIGKKMLVYRRDAHVTNFPLHIDLPGGGKEKGESPFDTFQRELNEEFGIKVGPDDVAYSRQYMSFMDPSKESYFIATKPLDIKEGDIVFGDEGLEFFLITLDKYLQLSDAIDRHKNHVADYKEAIESLKN